MNLDIELAKKVDRLTLQDGLNQTDIENIGLVKSYETMKLLQIDAGEYTHVYLTLIMERHYINKQYISIDKNEAQCY